MRKGLPDLRNRSTNSGAPGTGWPSWTRTPSMSVSQDSTGLRSVMGTSVSAGCCGPGSAGWTATDVTEIPGGNTSQSGTNGLRVEPLGDQLPDHPYEARIVTRGGRAGEIHTQLLGGVCRLVVQVPDHLQVVGDEADRTDHHPGGTGGRQRPQVVAHVGFEPRHLRRSGAALPHQVPR